MRTIMVYYRDNSEVSLQAIKWLKSHNCTIQLRKISTITHREIFQLIYLSELDIPDILNKTNKFSFFAQKKKNKLSCLRFSDGLSFLERHPELLQDPIILSNKYSLIGFNEQKIQGFLQ
ncbi:ArsC/Spx/MgsR family protein [Lactococcus garvieae]|jgi:arsenate reductase-like glutaredoxin family protein|uniref:ArsC/Spx/MgsR family protein n=1 Tax=Lactococcus garvieae TaxID=1363 RepID=UPI0005B3D554|nr:ArsC/Spx/MgsR family protein [Lactococcus garvieae]QPS71171.1 hypothetical protein I6G50_00470 [Lactococcus garvieae]